MGCRKPGRADPEPGEPATWRASAPSGDESAMTPPKSLAGDLEAAVQDELQEIVEKLKDIERRLREIHRRLPAPADAETAQEAEDERDVSTVIRSIIECVLADSLEPAMRDLQAASLYRVGSRLK
jgi:hypothetical protein